MHLKVLLHAFANKITNLSVKIVANIVDTDRTAPIGTARFGSTLSTLLIEKAPIVSYFGSDTCCVFNDRNTFKKNIKTGVQLIP